MAELDIRQTTVLEDNYVYVLHDPDSGATAAVDPAAVDPVEAVLKQTGWTLSHIFVTHHHMDHVGGNRSLVQRHGCTVVGSRADSSRIPGIKNRVGDGETFAFGSTEIRVLETPGHTTGHVAYWHPDSRAVFTGDTLFSLGCGRLFEGSPQQMWQSLLKLRRLPPDTRVFCGHEYTEANARFALSVDPNNHALQARAAEVTALRRDDQPTVPSTLEGECNTNPFLRADQPALAAAIGLPGSPAVVVFANLRQRKDGFSA